MSKKKYDKSGLSTKVSPMNPKREITFDEYIAEGEKKFGKDKKDWRYQCPMCGAVQSYHDFKELTTLNDERISSYLGFSCIGRYTEKNVGCDWTLGGLLQLHTLTVLDKEGNKHPRFEFARVEENVKETENAD